MLKNCKVHLISIGPSGTHRLNVIDELSLNEPSQVEINDMVHCNGLLLCITKGNVPVVWNPCTGQTKWVVEPRSSAYEISDRFAFGYEIKKSCYNYKILRAQNTRDFEIYEFNSNSWRILDATQDWYIKSRVVSLKGNAYFYGSKYEDGVVANGFLVSFDFSKEIFESMCVPFEHNPEDIVALSVIREEKLAVLFQLSSLEMEIWITDKIKPNDVSWKRFLTTEVWSWGLFETERFSYMTSFLIDEENKNVVLCDTNPRRDAVPGNSIDNTTMYVFVDDGKRKIVTRKHIDCSPLMYHYVPSLVQV